MKLFEFEAKNVFRDYGIGIPNGQLVDSESGVREAADRIGYPCVIKAQVLQGGRGKAGLIRLVHDEAEAAAAAAELCSRGRVEGWNRLLVEQAVSYSRELYLSVSVDPVSAGALVMASSSGGIEIETLASREPERIVREQVNMAAGLQPFQALNIACALTDDPDALRPIARVIEQLYRVFDDLDAELAEINPLFIDSRGAVVAGDGKLTIDDNSLSRHPEWKLTRDRCESDIAFEAALEGIPYLQFSGDISLMCAGAGLATTVYDLVSYAGGTVANYLEFGGPNYQKSMRAMELCLRNDSRVILIVTFGTIARADVMAEGIVAAIRQLEPDRPIVTCIRGTNEEEAVKILKAAGLEPLFDTEEAVARAVELCGEPDTVRKDRTAGSPPSADFFGGTA